MIDQELIIKKLEKALYLTSDVLNQSLVADISFYIHSREWGLAFDIMCENLYEYELPISQQTYKLLEDIGLSLHFEKDYWEMLKPQIDPGLPDLQCNK